MYLSEPSLIHTWVVKKYLIDLQVLKTEQIMASTGVDDVFLLKWFKKEFYLSHIH
jgi:hypothetical protein